MMKHIHKYKKIITPLLKMVIKQLQKIENLGHSSYIIATVEYFFAVSEVLDEKEFREVMRNGLTKTGDKIMSYADRLINRGYEKGIIETNKFRSKWIEEGKEQGMEQGIERGKIEVATKLLQHNSTPVTVAEITGLPLARILELQKTIENSSL